MLWILWQVVLGAVFVALAVTFFWLVATRRLLQRRRGWVWGYFRPWPLSDPLPNELLGLGLGMALVGAAHGIGSVLMWVAIPCALLMVAASILRAWQLR